MGPAGINPRLALIGGDTPSTWIIYNRLVREFGLFDAIIEKPVPRSTLLRWRIRKLGWLNTLSQIAFVALIRPLLRYASVRRIRDLCKANDLETTQPLTAAVKRVENINAPDSIAMLESMAPKIVIVSGTRILKRNILQSVKAAFINAHQGVTPLYRGAHGGYWALHEKDPANCGVTIHLVDEGIDTGHILAQALISPAAIDNFVTYPFLQLALPLLVTVIRNVAAGTATTRSARGNSDVWYHPGFFQYLKARLRGVR